MFVGSFSMCHVIPIADRLDRQPLTVPLAELLLTKLQIVKLTERDQRDIYNLCFHHEVVADGGPGDRELDDRRALREGLGAVANRDPDDRSEPASASATSAWTPTSRP